MLSAARSVRQLAASMRGFAAAADGALHSAGSSGEVVLEPLAGRPSTAKKHAILKTLTGKPRRELSPQGGGAQMLPPGCSMSDPTYSIKDTIHFHDPVPATK